MVGCRYGCARGPPPGLKLTDCRTAPQFNGLVPGRGAIWSGLGRLWTSFGPPRARRHPRDQEPIPD
jgi:hypothetical protein